jgi:hypothetical protein
MERNQYSASEYEVQRLAAGDRLSALRASRSKAPQSSGVPGAFRQIAVHCVAIAFHSNGGDLPSSIDPHIDRDNNGAAQA